MAKRRTRLFISVFACAMLFMYGALNCAYADDSSDDANSWRFFHGELVLSDSGASTDNLDTFEEAAADSADGVMACSVEPTVTVGQCTTGSTSSIGDIALVSARIKA